MRRTVEVRIEGNPEENRDAGKLFLVTEMPATQGERWFSRLVVLLAESGAEIPEDTDMATDGAAGAAALLKLGAPFLKVLQDPSLEEWWSCIKYQHKANQLAQPIIQGERCQIEEIGTVARLRMEVVNLHLGFFRNVSPSTSVAPSSQDQVATGSSPTRISRPQSVR